MTIERKRKKQRNAGRFAAALAVSLAVSSAVLSAGAFPAYAAEKIKSVKLTFETSSLDADGIPVVEGDTTSEKYSVSEVVLLEEYEEDRYDDDDDDDDDEDRTAGRWDGTGDAGSVYGMTTADPEVIARLIEKNYKNSSLLAYNQTYRSMGVLPELVYVAELEAADGYSFYVGSDSITLNGLEARYIKHERADSRKKLILYVKFAGLDSLAGTVQTAGWSSAEHGIGAWDSAGRTVSYELQLDRDGSQVIRGKTTAAVQYDFRPYMLEAGTYTYHVRPVSAGGEKGEWTDSVSCYVSAEQAAYNQNRFGLDAEPVFEGDGPPVGHIYHNVGWQQDSGGAWWYHEQDGGYIQANWLKDGGFWYYFNENGFLASDAYVSWGGETCYVDGEGKLLVNGKAPDGRIADGQGRLAWP